ncbi:MAG: CTP synthase [Candidatus Aenigmarchaeota archaeon]|nr:CTP synthase [Candidatus Aenigmarchaeota archaeon]
MKFIVVVGGVISGVGKGIATASIGKIMQEHGFSTTAVKIDPYINYDAGTLRPTEHGEVWVTDDGGEIDQDLGNYERFLGYEIPKRNNITTGQVYKELIDRERRGEFLGQTVEVIPHVPNEIKRRIKEAGQGFDIVLVEVGGTVGDYQNMPYLFATKSLEMELGKENVIHILVTYLPVPYNIGEMKTKPTQQAIKMLNEAGIFPDFVLCRAGVKLDDVRKKKIEANSNVNADHIISAPDVDTIYQVPLNFEAENLGGKLIAALKLQPRKQPDWSKWENLVKQIRSPRQMLNIAIVGKYVDIGEFSLIDSYISVNEAVRHAAANAGVGAKITWVDSKTFEKNTENLNVLKNYEGIIVPGGFGASGVEGKIAAIKFVRENNIPYLGLCYGMQLAVVEFARNVCGLQGANTTENDPATKYPIIDILPTQRHVLAESIYGASMRLGAYAAALKPGTKVLELYRKTGRLEKDMKKIAMMKDRLRLGALDRGNAMLERHRHRYEVNPAFIDVIEKNGMVFSGFHTREDGTKLMEFIEMPQHKYFIATQAHPEFKSSLEDPAPLFLGFVEACRRK